MKNDSNFEYSKTLKMNRKILRYGSRWVNGKAKLSKKIVINFYFIFVEEEIELLFFVMFSP